VETTTFVRTYPSYPTRLALRLYVATGRPFSMKFPELSDTVPTPGSSGTCTFTDGRGSLVFASMTLPTTSPLYGCADNWEIRNHGRTYATIAFEVLIEKPLAKLIASYAGKKTSVQV
jgi:hypothetical protein